MSIVTAVRDMDRLRQIAQVLLRHGFGELVARMGLSGSKADGEQPKVAPPDLGRRLRLVLQDLGPTFVKLGQILSTRGDLIPQDILIELKQLQDQVAPFPAEQARQQIEESLGAPVESLFEAFESEPIASASVAQVHRALLRVEEQPEPVPVAVKIQRPGIVEKVQRDLDLLYILARMIERAVPETRFYSPAGLVREFDHAISAELDFTIEASNAERFAANFSEERVIRFPKVFAQASGKRVLTLEYLDGLKLEPAVAAGASGEWIANTAAQLLLKMIFEDGFFHADPHPGNVLILPRPEADGRYLPEQPLVIGLLDLGLVGRLSPELRDQGVDLLLAAARDDPDGIADAMLAIGRPRGRVDQAAFRDYVRRISERHLGRPLAEIDASAIVRDIVTGAARFEIEIPMELTMMLRAIMTIEGVGKEIHPAMDLFAVAKPYLATLMWQRYHPLRLSSDLLKGAGRLSLMARDLPFQLQDILEDLRQGRLRLYAVDPERARATELLGRRVRAAVIIASLGGSATALLIAGRESLVPWAYGALGLAGLWLVVHLVLDLFSGKRPLS